jgi:hypothetical protein
MAAPIAAHSRRVIEASCVKKNTDLWSAPYLRHWSAAGM